MPNRQSEWETDITVDDIHLGKADKWDGGGIVADSTTYFRATGPKNLGGTRSRSTGTATYLYDETLDASFRALDAGAGSLNAVIHRTPLGDDGTPMASGGYTLTGKLKEVPQPAGDYSSNDGADVAIVFDLDPDIA